jgi:hypothetical protein
MPPATVTPAQAGVQFLLTFIASITEDQGLDSSFRWSDERDCAVMANLNLAEAESRGTR